MQVVNAYCERLLNFEVPLEDVFQENDVHSAIKNLFEAAFRSISESGFPIADVTSSLQGSLCERLLLKDQLLSMGYFSGDEASPGAYLWVIRHFLGLLPLPLLPAKTHNKNQPWNFLCDLCEKLLGEPCSRMCMTYCYSVARYINRLSDANRMLLLNFMSLLTSLSGFENNKAIAALANYFASALFVRPYYPGDSKKRCKHDYYFMIFMMIHWDSLSYLCITPKGFEIQTFENKNIKFAKLVRTSLPFVGTTFDGNRNYLFELDDWKKRSCAISKATQTSHQLSRSISEQSVRGSKISLQAEHPVSRGVDDEERNKEENIEKASLPEGKLGEDENLTPRFSGEDEYFYDEDYKEQSNALDQSEALLDKVAKLGWTYTPPVASPRIGWNINKENYNLSFDNNESEGEAKSTELLETPQAQSTEKSSQKSGVSLQSIQSKLKFLKKLRPSLRHVKKSPSAHDTSCNIKYEKMDSCRTASF